MQQFELKALLNILVSDDGSIQVVEGRIKMLDKAMQQTQKSASKSAQSMNSEFRNLARTLASVFGISLAGRWLAQTTSDMIRLGAEVQTTTRSFELMMQSVGRDSRQLYLMQEAADGTVNSLKLMQLAGTAVAGVSAEVGGAISDALPTFVEIARAAYAMNPALGSVEAGVNALVMGVKRLEKRLVDNVGLQIKVADANREYADSIGKTVSQLSAEEKQLAFIYAIQKDGVRLIEQVGDSIDSEAASIEKAAQAWKELKQAIASAVFVGASGFDRLASSFTVLAGAISSNEVKRIQGEIGLISGEIANLEKQLAEGDGFKMYFLGGEETIQKSIEDRRKALKGLTQELKDVMVAQENIRRQMAYPEIMDPTRLPARTTTGRDPTRSRLEQQARKADEAATALLNLDNAFRQGKIGEEEWISSSQEVVNQFYQIELSAQQTAEEILAFYEALDQARNKTKGPQAVIDVITKIDELLGRNLAAPKLPDNFLLITQEDVDVLDNYIAALRRGSDAEKVMADELQQHRNVLLDTRGAMLDFLNVAGPTAETKIQALVTALYGADGSIRDLMEDFEKLPEDVQKAIPWVEALTMSIEDLRDEAEDPVTITVITDEVSDAMDDIDRSLNRLIGIKSLDEIKKMRAQAQQDITSYAQNIPEGMTESDYRMGLAQVAYDHTSTYDTIKENYDDAQRASERAWNDMVRDAERAMQEMKDLIAQQLTPSFDVEGLAPGLLEREDEVDEHYRRLAAIALRGQEEMDKHQKDWADTWAKIPDEVKKGGMGAIQEWAKGQLKLYSKGIINPDLIDKEKIKQNVRDAIQAQAITDALVDEIYQEMGGTATRSQIEAAMGVGGPGEYMADGIVSGYKDSVDPTAMVLYTASAIMTAAENNNEQLKAAGKDLGKRIMEGLKEEVKNGSGDVIGILAGAIAPSVVSYMNMQALQHGDIP